MINSIWLFYIRDTGILYLIMVELTSIPESCFYFVISTKSHYLKSMWDLSFVGMTEGWEWSLAIKTIVTI
jgi:hypothetical protein